MNAWSSIRNHIRKETGVDPERVIVEHGEGKMMYEYEGLAENCNEDDFEEYYGLVYADEFEF